jgi:hypothetical protein
MPTWQPQLPALAASPAGLSHALDSPSSTFQIVPSRTNDLHKSLRVAEFVSVCMLLMFALLNSVTAPVLVSLSSWRVFLLSLDSLLSSSCSLTICTADFPFTNLQPHKSTLLIYPTVDMVVSTLRHYFGQPAEMCTSCKFDTVFLIALLTVFLIALLIARMYFCLLFTWLTFFFFSVCILKNLIASNFKN